MTDFAEELVAKLKAERAEKLAKANGSSEFRNSLPEMKPRPGLLEEWLLTLLKEGRLPFPAPSKPRMSGPTTLLHDAKFKIPRLRDLSFNALAVFLQDWGCVKIGGDARYWRFPPLAEMRAEWDQQYSPHAWPSISDWGHQA